MLVQHEEIHPLPHDIILEVCHQFPKITILGNIQRLASFDGGKTQLDNFAVLDDKFRPRLPVSVNAMNVYRLVLVRVEPDDHSKIFE